MRASPSAAAAAVDADDKCRDWVNQRLVASLTELQGPPSVIVAGLYHWHAADVVSDCRAFTPILCCTAIVRGLADRDDLDCLWFALHDFGISACEHWTDVSGERTLTNRHHTRPYSTKEVYEGEVVWKSCYSNSSEWPHRSLDRCIVFARWCQCEPLSNTRFLGPTGVCPLKRYLKFSIGSAVLLYFVAWR